MNQMASFFWLLFIYLVYVKPIKKILIHVFDVKFSLIKKK